MTGIEPRTSGIVSNRSTNWATTTAHYFLSFVYFDEMLYNEGGTPPKGISTKKMRRHLCCHRRSLSNKKQLLMHQMDGWMTNHQNTSQMLSVKAIYFRLFSKKTANLIQLDSQSNCWRLDANRGCLVSETTALPNCATTAYRLHFAVQNNFNLLLTSLRGNGRVGLLEEEERNKANSIWKPFNLAKI